MSENQCVDDLLVEARERVGLLSQSLPKSIDPAGISLTAKIPYKVLIYRESIIWRTEEIARTTVQHYSNKELASALILTRALMEGVGAAWYLLNSMQHATESNDLDVFDDKILKLLIGSKSDVTDVSAINVLTFIDRADKNVTGFRNVYDGLCEFAHPNWSGTSLLFARNDHDEIFTEFGNNPRGSRNMMRQGLNALLGGLIAFEYAYNQISDLMPAFIKTCENDLEL